MEKIVVETSIGAHVEYEVTQVFEVVQTRIFDPEDPDYNTRERRLYGNFNTIDEFIAEKKMTGCTIVSIGDWRVNS